MSQSNPLLKAWTTPFGLPPYATTTIADFAPAFAVLLPEQAAVVADIAAATEPATFANTIIPLEASNERLGALSAMFYGLAGTDTTPDIQALERDLAPKMTAHHMAIAQNERLFQRVDAIDRDKARLDLDAEQLQVLARYVRMFVRAGARLDTAGKARLKAIAERSATLGTRFGQNVLKDEQDWSLVLDADHDLDGLAADVAAAARAAGDALGTPGKAVITLSRSSIVPFLEQSTRRDLREIAFQAWSARGTNGGASDNRAVLSELLALRAEAAALLGFATFADSSLEFTMAKTPAAVIALLDKVWAPARAAADAERALLQAAAQSDGAAFEIGAADWRHYAEKVRKARFDLDEGEIKPYLQLDQMIAAAFDCARKLFGIEAQEIAGVALHHPEARLWEIKRDGHLVGHFIGDYFARASKRSGAWMSALRSQHRLAGTQQTPIVTNTCNFAKPASGSPALLSLDDARTLFHEFGHALHGLLSNVSYPSISGTRVARDFVELPSQLFEHWLMSAHVLKNFARHVDTGAVMPDELIARVKAARNFGQGFASVEFLASAYVDMDFHTRGLNAAAELDIDQAEAQCLQRIGMPSAITMRHRPGHFQHIVGGYAAGYYSYLWSEVLDADAFSAFEATGNVFDPATARKLHDHVYSSGAKQEADAAYISFRGRLPDATALLAKRGFGAKVA
jgi:peptidyl-dipeptidase Dcp